MSVSENGISYSTDAYDIESLLQSINEKLETTNETLSILAEPNVTDRQSASEKTLSDNSVLIYESLQRMEQRQNTNIKLFTATGGLVLIAVGILIGLSVMRWLPKR